MTDMGGPLIGETGGVDQNVGLPMSVEMAKKIGRFFQQLRRRLNIINTNVIRKYCKVGYKNRLLVLWNRRAVL